MDEGVNNTTVYSNVGLTTKASDEIASESTENCRFRQPQCRLTPPLQGTPANIRINLILPETTFIRPHLRQSTYVIQMFVVGSENACILKLKLSA